MTLMDVSLKYDEMLYDCFNYVIEKLNISGAFLLATWFISIYCYKICEFMNSMATTWLTWF